MIIAPGGSSTMLFGPSTKDGLVSYKKEVQYLLQVNDCAEYCSSKLHLQKKHFNSANA